MVTAVYCFPSQVNLVPSPFLRAALKASPKVTLAAGFFLLDNPVPTKPAAVAAPSARAPFSLLLRPDVFPLAGTGAVPLAFVALALFL